MATRKKTSRRSRAATLPSRRALLVIALVLILLSAAIAAAVLSSAPKTQGERVQAQMPAWVDQQLLTPNEYSRPQIPLDTVNAIVIHYVGNPGTSAAANRSYFEGLATSGETHASSNFIVGLEGEIIECVPVDEVAYCSSSRNYDTISIEVCHSDADGQFSDVTMASVVKLTAWLCEKFNLSADDVIRHYDVTGKECPLYYVRHSDAWDALKEAVRAQMAAAQ